MSYQQFEIMSLDFLTIIIGVLAILMAGFGFFRADLLRAYIKGFPRSIYAGWILAGLCCLLGTREALAMNMGGLNAYKIYIYLIAPLVFIGSVTCLKELLAPRALGALLCLVAVPITKVAVFSGQPYFQIISALAYFWVIIGLVWFLAPWQFRQMHQRILENDFIYYSALGLKALFGVVFILLGFFVY